MKNDLEKMRAPGIRPFLFRRGILAAASMAAFAWTDAARADDQDLDWAGLWADCLARQRGLMWNKDTRRALSAYAERFEILRDRPLAEKCAVVNAAVNKDIAFVWDQWNYAIEERFATPAETLRERRGDCEDFAIMKYFLLRHLDVPADNLLLAVVDIPDGKHMVLLAGQALPSLRPETTASSWARARRVSWS